jgi:hypothetical protein
MPYYNIRLLFFLFLFFNAGKPPIEIFSIKVNSVYKIKSGIVYYRTVLPFRKEIVLYFDEYGKKECVRIENMIGEAKQMQVLIKLGDFQYMMMDSLQCIKANRKKKFSLENLDITALDDASKKEYGIILDKNRITLLNKDCDKYIINSEEKDLKGEILLWNNIPLKITTERKGFTEITEAYKIELNKKIPPDVFELPKGIEILDMTAVDNN